jgi:hypothetical protein
MNAKQLTRESLGATRFIINSTNTLERFTEKTMVTKKGERTSTLGGYDRANNPGAVGLLKPAIDARTSKVMFERGVLGNEKEEKDIIASLSLVDKDYNLIDNIENLNPTSDLWKNSELKREILLAGDEFSLDNPRDIFWIALTLAHPKWYYVGINKRPPTMAMVDYIVTRVQDDSNDILSQEMNTGLELSRKVVRMSIGKKKLVCSYFKIDFAKNTSEDKLESLIIAYSTINQDQAVHLRSSDVLGFVDEVSVMTEDKVKISALVFMAIENSVFDRKDGIYHFDSKPLGDNIEDVENELLMANHKKTVAAIADVIKKIK